LRTDGFGYDYQFNMTNELKTLFITDSQEVNQKYLIKVKEKSSNPQNQGNVFTEYVAKKELSKSQLINYFTPILSFEPKDEAQFPLDVNRTSWEKSKSEKSQLLPKSDSQGFLDLSEFKNKKFTDTKFAKIYASVVEKEWQDQKSKQRISELAINYYFHYSQSNWKDHGGFNNHEGDWEGITLFLRKDVDNRYYPCRIAFAQHVSFARDILDFLKKVLGEIPFLDNLTKGKLEEWKGGQVVEWSNLKLRLGDDIYNVTNVAQNPTKTQIYQPVVYVGLGGHASYPDGGSTNYKIENPNQIGSTSHGTGIEYHRGGNDINLRGKVEYLPPVGKGINAKELQGKEWLLYPGTWGNPKKCSNTTWLNVGCPSAPQGPVFMDVKLVGIGSRSEGLGQRWLDPWEWSKNFEGADKIKGCPPPQEEPKPEPTPDIPRKPDGNTGVIYGDPHIVTFDGLRNSFQAVGEFILAKSERGDFEVQGRFKGVGDNASLPSAVAIKAGGERIGIYQGKLQINARNVNEASLPIILEGGARVDKNGAEYRIIAPTGEWVEVSGSSVLTIKVTVPKSRISKMYGLLGNYNNSPNDDLKTRQGKVVGINPNYEQLYKEYGNSWRIPQPESLFAYEVGETSATFTNLNFPKKVLTLADFTTQQKQEAERVCRSAGVTASAMLESCMFDVLVTGDRSFANVSAYVQSEVKVTANVTPLTEQKKPTVTTETQKPSSNNSADPISNSNYVLDYTIQGSVPNNNIGLFGVTLISFSPDSKQLRVVNFDGNIMIINSAIGKIERTFKTNSYNTEFAVSSDNKLFATKNNELTEIWNLTTGKLVRKLKLKSKYIKNIAFSPDTKRLGIGEASSIDIWNLETGKLERTLKRESEYVNDYELATFIPHNNRVVVGVSPSKMRIWNLATGKVERILNIPSCDVLCIGDFGININRLAVSPDGKQIAKGTSNGIELWNLTTGKLELTLYRDNRPYRSRSNKIHSVAFTPDGKRLVSGEVGDPNPTRYTESNRKSDIKIWNLATGQLENSLNTGQGNVIHIIVFSPNGRRLATVLSTGLIYVWKAKE
jgi:WD40 repeat protein